MVIAARPAAGAEPVWAAHRRRVPGAPADLTLHVLDARAIEGWALAASACLSAHEQQRAEGLRFEVDRTLFLVSRVALRHVLGHRLGCPAQQVPLHRDALSAAPLPILGQGAATGVDGPQAEIAPLTTVELAQVPSLRYSISRTEGRIAIAAARRAVGVDVESLQTRSQAEALLAVLHPEDQDRLRRMTARGRAAGATRAWTRVEALLKGRGTGLGVDPQRVASGTRALECFDDGWCVSDVRTRARESMRLAVAWQSSSPGRG